MEVLSTPQRIVSVVPSQTELLSDLGLEEAVVGITKFCVHPEKWFRNKTRVGGTKQLHIDIIKELKPDLVLANKEENIKEQIEELANTFPVWISDVNNLQDSLEMMASIGEMTNKQQEATTLISQIKNGFDLLGENVFITAPAPPRTAYLIWKEPYMTVGGDTFINNMLQHAGFKNVFDERTRYPSITVDDLIEARCELLLLSSEPYPFKQKHIDELKAQLPSTKIYLVDGEMFSWYGSHLVKAPAYFQQLQQEIQALC